MKRNINKENSVGMVINFSVCSRNRLLSAGLEPALSQTEKSFIASNYRQLSKLPFFLARASGPSELNKTGFNLKNFHFNIRGKLSIIRCDKCILSHAGIHG